MNLVQRYTRVTVPAIAAALMAFAPSAAGDDLYESPRHLAAQATIALPDAKSRCAPALVRKDETCAVGEFGRVGAVGSHEFFYARYDLKQRDDPLVTPRIVIFERATSAALRPILISGDDPAFIYEKPVILHSGNRTLLHIPAYESGTGNFNHESLYVWAQNNWRDVEIAHWLNDFGHRLPKELAVWKGVFPDYAKMKAETPLWNTKRDGNCCPTGGEAKIDLQWRGDSIALRGFRIGKSTE